MSTRKLLALLSLCLFVVACAPSPNATPGPTSTPRPTATHQPSATPTTRPYATPTQSAETITAENLILASIGEPNPDVAWPTTVSINHLGLVAVTFPANNGPTPDLVRSDTLSRVVDIARIVHNTDSSYFLSVDVIWKVTDIYGVTTEDVVMRIDLTGATMNRIQFDTFNSDNLPLIADMYMQHPAFDED